ncbi:MULTISPECIES: XdhC family protein [Providencia]|uniref:XdhC/CoxF family xanthine dehydrogenase maturation factor n=1 Tax=Providencia heimbachae ATCC 35613 TaxID=1354272 RepID=A0A1B7JNT4_9GAMM|nr:MULTISPECIES: XdhC family protein [Providencia]MBP6122133.1 XdhC family protein [Providencia sp.]MDD9340251.1 XdhC family protein [Providencia heimbachae]NIH21674.1 XdhC family protein [Providencia heimbachae]OAT49561.1 XdhC/CoxF family xanthine dehydrogenase maturation factor [Providencia heimbachae ATCC 35613]QCJ69220.1 XdhC family protein [Providencia heimbachae]
MLREDVFVITQAITWIKTEPVWLCTVLSTYGSSPRSPGSLLVAKADGQYSGSLSGGCIEEDFIERIQDGAYLNASHIVRYGQGGIEAKVNLPCDGSLDVLIEYLPNGNASYNYLLDIQRALQGYTAIIKKVTLPMRGEITQASNASHLTQIERQDNTIQLYIAAPPRLIIAGISNVGLYCADFALTLGFEVIICEHREEELSRFADQISPQIDVIPLFPARYLEENSCTANTAIVSLTHDPRIDDLTLMEAVNTSAFYIGAMGSSRTSARRRERLISSGGMTNAELDRIHAPIGIPIGSKTPSEIALAVMADIVFHKNTHQYTS